jgi:hypothetical protein
VIELSAYEFSALRDGPFTLSRGHGDGLAPILLVAPAVDSPSRESLERLEHEYALRTELDADWAARPVELLRREAPEGGSRRRSSMMLVPNSRRSRSNPRPSVTRRCCAPTTSSRFTNCRSPSKTFRRPECGVLPIQVTSG